MKVRFKVWLLAVFLVFGWSATAMAVKSGGVLKMIFAASPKVIGYFPEIGPTEISHAFPGVESIMELTEDRVMEPFLAESVDMDRENLVFTIKLKQGIKFHDGSLMDAEAVAWNYQLALDTKRIQFADQVEQVEIVDKYTVRLHLKSYNNQMTFAYGWVPIFSKQAFDQHGKEWCRFNLVGTGPFKQKDFKVDTHLIWEKFPDYWQKGKPYLDGMEVRYIPDPVTASAMMLANESDLWLSAAPREQYDLEKQGLKRQTSWPALPSVIYLNTKDKDTPLSDIRVREAVEYAIDKASIAKAIGFGYMKPLDMVHPPGEWAYDPDYKGRKYDPDKARRLLKEAGYAKGIKLDLLVFPAFGGGTDTAQAIEAMLGDVGIQVNVDVADPGRYFGSLFGTGWKHMILSFVGLDHNSLVTFNGWFSHDPRAALPSLEKTPKLLELSKKSVLTDDEAEQRALTRQMSREVSDQVLAIPLFYSPLAIMMQPYVHTNYMKTGLIRWETYDIWMDK